MPRRCPRGRRGAARAISRRRGRGRGVSTRGAELERQGGRIGFCSGGRQSVLAACNLDLDAAVDCYGGMVVGTPGPNSLVAAVVRRPAEPQLPVAGRLRRRRFATRPRPRRGACRPAARVRQGLRVPQLRGAAQLPAGRPARRTARSRPSKPGADVMDFFARTIKY